MNSRRLQEQRRANLLWSVAILGTLAAMLAVLGWLIAGAAGLAWTLALGALSLLIEQRAGAAFLRKYLGAEPIPAWLAPDLHGIAGELAWRAGLPRTPRLHYIPTRAVQALATGTEHDAAIGLSDGLLRLLSPRELAAVLAHEIWHVRQRDLVMMRLAAAATQLTHALCFTGFALCLFYLPLILSGEAEPAWPVLLLLVVAPSASMLLWLALSRTREFDADAGAAALTGDPEALASALRRLEIAGGRRWEMLHRGVAPVWSSWLSTHPSAEQRIARLLELAPPRRRVLRIPVFRIGPIRPGGLDGLGRPFV